MIKNNSLGIYSTLLRKAGLVLSGLCAIHCLLVPIFITLLPVFGHFIKFNFWVELSIYSSILFFGGGLMMADYRHHKIKKPLLLFLAGFIIIVGSHFLSNLILNNILIILGGIALATGQILNISLHKKINH